MYSAEERTEALNAFTSARAGLRSALSGLSEAQLNFTPATAAWSIRGLAEHIAIVEERIAGRIEQMLAATPAPGASVFDSDATLLETMTDRTRKIQAPDVVYPTGKSLTDSMSRLAATERKFHTLIESAPNDFRQRFLAHPAFGPIDGHQWLMTLAAHCVRHTAQINEVKATPGYPK